MDIRSTQIINPDNFKNKHIHIIGCGATGGHLAIQLIKLGFNMLYLWDFDTVEEHNLTNQIWDISDIGSLKTEALKKHIFALDPDAKLILKGKYTDQDLDGIVFNCVDSIELRKKIYDNNEYNTQIEVMFDPRLGSRECALYTYEWKEENIHKLQGLSDFKDDEMDVERSLCGTPVNIGTTLQSLVNYIVCNFINYMNKDVYYSVIVAEPLRYNATFMQKQNQKED